MDRETEVRSLFVGIRTADGVEHFSIITAESFAPKKRGKGSQETPVGSTGERRERKRPERRENRKGEICPERVKTRNRFPKGAFGKTKENVY